MINAAEIDNTLNEAEKKLHNALLAFYDFFRQSEWYLSEDGLIIYTCEKNIGSTHHVTHNHKTIKFTRLVQLSNAIEEIKNAFPDKHVLEEQKKDNLVALFMFYKKSAHSYINFETPSFPIVSNMIEGGQGGGT